MRKVRLLFKGISEITGSDGLALIILRNPETNREISIVCDKNMETQIALQLKHPDEIHPFLADALYNIIANQTNIKLEIVIDDLINGVYIARIYNILNAMDVGVRASDAVLLSLMGDVPIFIEEGLMHRQSVPQNLNENGMSIPVNTINLDMLQDALEKAVEREDYEQASQLRDEIRRRKGKGDGKKDKDERD